MLLENNWFLTALIIVNALLAYRLYNSQLWTLFAGKPRPTSPIAYKMWTLEELHQYNGVDNPRILLAIKGLVYDVTDKGSSFYGPGTTGVQFLQVDRITCWQERMPVLRWRRSSSPVARQNSESAGYDLSALSEKEQDVLDGWVRKFESKYVLVGKLH